MGDVKAFREVGIVVEADDDGAGQVVKITRRMLCWFVSTKRCDYLFHEVPRQMGEEVVD